MELMRENIALNAYWPTPTQTTDAETSEQESQDLPTLAAKTLDWDEPLPEWVTATHPDIIMLVNLRYKKTS